MEMCVIDSLPCEATVQILVVSFRLYSRFNILMCFKCNILNEAFSGNK